MSSQYIDSMSLPALFNQLTGLTRLEMRYIVVVPIDLRVRITYGRSRSPSALAAQELMVLTSVKVRTSLYVVSPT